jgi:hypothetical protein
MCLVHSVNISVRSLKFSNSNFNTLAGVPLTIIATLLSTPQVHLEP